VKSAGFLVRVGGEPEVDGKRRDKVELFILFKLILCCVEKYWEACVVDGRK
jgi:hypothetical protein